MPRIGETVSLHGDQGFRIRDVQWWLDDPEHAETGRPRLVIQLITE